MPNFRRTRSNCRSFIWRDVFAVNQHFAGVGFQQPDQMFEQNAFAAPAAPDDDRPIRRFQCAIHAVQDGLRAELLLTGALQS